MAITVQCPCGTRLKVRDEVAGKNAKCPKCGGIVKVGPPSAPVADTSPAYCPFCDQPLKPADKTCPNCGKTPGARADEADDSADPSGLGLPADEVYLEVGNQWSIGLRTYQGAVLATQDAIFIIGAFEFQVTGLHGLIAGAAEALGRQTATHAEPARVPFSRLLKIMTGSPHWPLGDSETRQLHAGVVEIIPKTAIESMKVPLMSTLKLAAFGRTYTISGLTDKNMVRSFLKEWGYGLS